MSNIFLTFVVMERYPIAFHTVDVAIIKEIGDSMYCCDYEIALIQKHNEVNSDFWRLPGGFVDPEKDNSAEDAAVREVKEEVGIEINIDDLVYLGSYKIDDPRFRDGKDKVITSLFIIFVYADTKLIAGDDAAKAEWINTNINHMWPPHSILYDKVIEYINELN